DRPILEGLCHVRQQKALLAANPSELHPPRPSPPTQPPVAGRTPRLAAGRPLLAEHSPHETNREPCRTTEPDIQLHHLTTFSEDPSNRDHRRQQYVRVESERQPE